MLPLELMFGWYTWVFSIEATDGISAEKGHMALNRTWITEQLSLL
jgi:hypothetical protein